MEQIKSWFAGLDSETLMGYAIEYGTALLSALAIFIIGKWIARKLSNFSATMMERAEMDETIVGFLSNIVYYVLFTMVVIAAIGTLGVETTSLAAVIAAAGLAIGLALQGSLSNLAAGVMIVMFRPFKKGDLVEAAGAEGLIHDISIFTTTMNTLDHRAIIIPNSKILDGNITNYTANNKRRIDMVIGVGYGDDLQKTKKVLTDVVKSHKQVLAKPAPQIAVSELADSSVNFVVRPWVKTADYWDVCFELTEQIKERLDKEGISIPFPQRDVHHYDSNVVSMPTPTKPRGKKKAA